jgi:hypothetical protein
LTEEEATQRYGVAFTAWYLKECKRQGVAWGSYDFPDAYADWREMQR